jgi:hypothetical protein
MPAIMIILNTVFITGVVVGIVGLLAWGIISDRPFATYLTSRAMARTQRGTWAGTRDRRRVPREVAGYRGPGRRAIDVGA